MDLVYISSKLEAFELSGGRKLLLGGLHLTCGAHFQTWLSYSSQKSYVKTWVGLVEIGGMEVCQI